MPSNTPPRSFLLLPDPQLSGAGDGILLESSFTSAALPDGAYADVAAPGSGNRGNLQVTQGGNPSTRANLSYRVVATGGVFREATWAWKRSTETTPADNLTSVWRGCNDGRYWWGAHDPFQDAGGAPESVTLVYSRINRREMIFRFDSVTNFVQVAYRSVDGHAYSADPAVTGAAWTISANVFDEKGNNIQVSTTVGSQYTALNVVELEDGVLAMIIVDAGGTDLRLLHSADGFTWTEVSRDILARFSQFGRAQWSFHGVRFARSGPYLRLAFAWFDDLAKLVVGGVSTVVRSMVSSDRGATWQEVTPTSGTAPAFLVLDPGEAVAPTDPFDPFNFTLGGLDDQAGSFLLVIGSGVSDHFFWTASGMDGWSRHDDLAGVLTAGPFQTGQIVAARGPEYFVLIYWHPDGSGDGIYADIYFVDPLNPWDLNSWSKYQANFFGDHGSMRFKPRSISLVNLGGNCLALAASLCDPEAGGTLVGQGMWYCRLGGWDQLPVEERDHPRFVFAPAYQHQPTGGFLINYYQLTLIAWEAWMGAPNPPAGPNVAAASNWTRPLFANVVQTWTTSRVIYNDAVALASRWTNRFTVGSPLFSWFVPTSTALDLRSGIMVEWVIKVDQGGDATLNADDIAVRLKSYDVLGGTGKSSDISVRMSGTSVKVWDNTIGANIIAPTVVAGLNAKAFVKFRLGILATPYMAAPQLVLLYRTEEDSTATWTRVGAGAISTAGAHTDQRIDWGHLTSITPAGSSNRRLTHWRRVIVFGPHDGGATRSITNGWGIPAGGAADDDSTLQTLRGRRVTYEPVLIEKGVTATLQGGAGFAGDSFEGTVNYSFHPRNITMIGSPRVGFRSEVPASGTTSVNLDYDAGWRDPGRRFQHAAAAVFGYAARSLAVIYSDSPTFSSPTVFSVDTTQYGPARINNSTAGNGIVILKADPAVPPLGEVRSVTDGVTYYLQVTAASCATANGKTYVVKYDQDWTPSQRLFVVEPGADNLDSFALAGASVVFFADRATVGYSGPVNKRYMRLQMAAVTTAYGNQQRLGTFVAGTTLVFTPPLEWSFSDAQQPNTTERVARGGLRWSYQEGPPQRVFEGDMVGDVDSLRRRMRSYLGALTGYDQFPLVFVHDDLDLKHPAKIMLGTVKSGSEFAQSGWKWDDAQQRWLAVGDMKLTINEEI